MADSQPTPVTLGTLIAPVRGRIVAGCALTGLGSVLAVGPAIAIAEVSRSLLAAVPDVSRTWTWVLVGIVCTVLSSLATMTGGHVCHQADATFRLVTRRRVVRHLMTVPLGWFVTRGSGEVKKAVGDDVKSIHTLVAHTFADATAAVAAPMVAIVYLVSNDWLLTLILLVYIVLALVATAPAMNRGYRKNMADWERAQADIAAGAVELVDGIEVVKAYGTRAGAFTRFTRANEQLSRVTVKWMSAMGTPNSVLTALYSASGMIAVTALCGTLFIAAGRFDVPVLIAFLTVGVGLPGGLMRMVALGYAAREAQAATAHLGGVLATPPLPAPSEDSADAVTPASGLVEFDDVSFAYDDGTRALDGISAVLAPGTVTAVVGASGSGKTTLARLVPRFWDVGGGSVRVGGADVRDVPARALLGRVAFVFQETVILRDTVAANLRLGRPEAREDELVTAARAARIHERITELPNGYDTVLGEDGGGLSGGERQRLAIARSILQDAPVVVLDEATAHADPESEGEVQQALSRLSRGKTVIVIAHRLHTIRHADQILVLDAGRVAERGTHEQLLGADGTYAALWRTQNPVQEPAAEPGPRDGQEASR